MVVVALSQPNGAMAISMSVTDKEGQRQSLADNLGS